MALLTTTEREEMMAELGRVRRELAESQREVLRLQTTVTMTEKQLETVCAENDCLRMRLANVLKSCRGKVVLDEIPLPPKSRPPSKKCAIPWCPNPTAANKDGECHAHHYRREHHGDPLRCLRGISGQKAGGRNTLMIMHRETGPDTYVRETEKETQC